MGNRKMKYPRDPWYYLQPKATRSTTFLSRGYDEAKVSDHFQIQGGFSTLGGEVVASHEGVGTRQKAQGQELSQGFFFTATESDVLVGKDKTKDRHAL